jgi:hypothetical protein
MPNKNFLLDQWLKSLGAALREKMEPVVTTPSEMIDLIHRVTRLNPRASAQPTTIPPHLQTGTDALSIDQPACDGVAACYAHEVSAIHRSPVPDLRRSLSSAQRKYLATNHTAISQHQEGCQGPCIEHKDRSQGMFEAPTFDFPDVGQVKRLGG